MTSESPPIVLHVRDVYKEYGERVVLDNIDLTVRKGEFCSVVGPSGCGKSTLLRLILGQEKPTAGTVEVDGQGVGRPGPDRGIVYQRYALFPHLSVLENVILGLKLPLSWSERLRRRQQLREQGMDVLERMRLEADAAKFPHQLSGGMQQRVAIAQAIVKNPKILLMDEPFGALDPGTREEMQEYIHEVWDTFSPTVFFVTHDLEEAAALGSRMFVLSQYYTDERGEGAQVRRGAKIVADYRLRDSRNSAGASLAGDVNDLIEEVRKLGFEPSYRQHASEFSLKHPDSWRTLTREESEGEKGD